MAIRMRCCTTFAAATLCLGLIAAHFASGQGTAVIAESGAKERARTVLSTNLPKLDGNRLKAILVEVRYGPGEGSLPHSHPCPVVAYVAEGAIRSQVKGQPERIYKAGESFYEPPNGVHLVSANASSTHPAKLIAFLICDHDTTLSVPVSTETRRKGGSK